MATRKFIDLDEAAKMLGVSTDTVTEMRDRGKIHGYRDGASWKFKPEEIERAIAEREAAEEEGEFAEVDEDPDSILLSEVELGQSDESTSSTIIGGKSSRDSADSDIQLAAPKSDSSVDLDSALTLDPSTGSDVLGGSEIGVGSSASGSGSGAESGSGVSPMFDELDTLDLDLPTAADSGISSKIFSDVVGGSDVGTSKTVMGSGAPAAEGSGLGLANEDELALGEAESNEGNEGGVGGDELGGDGDDDILLDVDSGGSAIDLAEDIDDDLVLGGSSHGDLSKTGDSGISLLDPADSGLSLESPPLELGGSAVESLDLGVDEDMLLTEDEAAEVEEGSEVAADEQSDDDFLLTPLEEASAEESDSGSQVIALDDDVEFEDAGGGVGLEDAGGLGGELETGGGLLEDDLGEGLGGGGLGAAALEPAPMQGVAAAAATSTTAAAPGPAAAPEAPFSGWNVASLAVCSVMLLLCGMFAFDLLRNMWSWNEAYSVNSSMMDMVLSWFEG